MLFRRTRSGPGASAQRKAREIRAAERRAQHRRALWAVPLLSVAAVGAGYAARNVGHRFAVALGIALALGGMHRLYRNGGSTWARGAAGERATARILAPLTWAGGIAVLHDRAIPRSKANLDHLIIGNRGMIYCDSKAWKWKATVRAGQLYSGAHNQSEKLRTVKWEARQASQALGYPVRPIIAVHGAPVPDGIVEVDGVLVIEAARLRGYLRSLPRVPGWTRADTAAERRRAERILPPAV
ncbi:nuclease-related domain-containing protein [Kitasatospora sp. NPDC088783]|uniref:nuclease-related domain-containing protein n=1 Tax=Kitasatospora sp. NPDC088783 TaxID=3364077 RepID=UPI0037F70B00